MPLRVAIIIVNYNNWADTIECLDSLKNLEYENFKVFLVDNGSSEKQPGNFKAENYRGIFDLEVIFTDKNLGFAGGNNVAIKKALANGFDYILLLNNDTIVEPDFLSRLVEVGESDEKIGIVGPLIYKYLTESQKSKVKSQKFESQDLTQSSQLPTTNYKLQTNEIWFAGGKVQFLPPKATHILKLPTTRLPSASPQANGGQANYQLQTTDYITGCCLLIKREVIDKIGLMPEDYFLYYEDVEWCLKAQKMGYKCVLEPSGAIYHKQSKSASEGSFSYIYYHTRNGLLFAKRNKGCIMKMAVFLYSFWLFFKQIIKYILAPSKRLWAKAIMKGIWDYWHNKTGKY